MLVLNTFYTDTVAYDKETKFLTPAHPIFKPVPICFNLKTIITVVFYIQLEIQFSDRFQMVAFYRCDL